MHSRVSCSASGLLVQPYRIIWCTSGECTCKTDGQQDISVMILQRHYQGVLLPRRFTASVTKKA